MQWSVSSAVLDCTLVPARDWRKPWKKWSGRPQCARTIISVRELFVSPAPDAWRLVP